MARLNIEVEALPRALKLARMMKVSDREALGTVAWLWRDSQDVLATEASREDIIDWSHLYELPGELVDEWVTAMERVRFITKLPDGRFRIHGNDVQIEGIVSRMHHAAKGGEATKKKWDAIKKKAHSPKHSPGPSATTPAARPEIADSTLPLGSDQCSAVQCIPVQKKAPPTFEAMEPPPTEINPDDLTGPIPELTDIPNAEILLEESVTRRGQEAWVKLFGLALVREELPKICMRWMTDPERAKRGKFPLYVTRSLEKEKAHRDKAPPPTPLRGPTLVAPERCELFGHSGDGEPVCKRVHRAGEFCELKNKVLEGFLPPTGEVTPHRNLSGRELAAGEGRET